MAVNSEKGKKKKPSGRRRGAESSATRAKLVECARQLILEEGYAAVTARRVAAKAGVKPPLIHYYFPTMDDLFVAVVRLGGDVNLEYLSQTLQSEQPLTAVWKLASDRDAAILSMQYLALATHRPAVRAEVKRYAEELRSLQTWALTNYLEAQGLKLEVPPLAAMTMITAISNLLQLEDVLDISQGHKETKAFIDKALTSML